MFIRETVATGKGTSTLAELSKSNDNEWIQGCLQGRGKPGFIPLPS